MADITTMSGPQAIAGLSRQLSSAIARAEEAERRVAEFELMRPTPQEAPAP